jgi:hypothetical protein
MFERAREVVPSFSVNRLNLVLIILVLLLLFGGALFSVPPGVFV